MTSPLNRTDVMLERPAREYSSWFREHPDWFDNEREILEKQGYALDQAIFDREGRVEFSGFSKADPGRKLYVRFPHSFPSAAPQIISEGPFLPRHHHYQTKQLCLFGFNEHRWNATMTVAAALQEADDLISEFKDGSHPTAHDEVPEPVTQILPYVHDAAVLVPPPISLATPDKPFGHFQIRYAFNNDSCHETRGRGVVTWAKFGDRVLTAHPVYESYLGSKAPQDLGLWYYHDGPPPSPETIRSRLSECVKQSRQTQRHRDFWLALIFNEESHNRHQTRLTWLLARVTKNAHPPVRTFLYTHEDRRARIPGFQDIEQKTVTIIGCGSVGSKIATSLAATGVSSLQLIDRDLMEPNNVVRHELGIDCFGKHKARALAERLSLLNPGIDVAACPMDFSVGGICTAKDEGRFLELLNRSDLIIDSTALHSVSHFINEHAFRLRVPSIFVSVTSGAWAGEIVQVVPGHTPCWVCWLAQYINDRPPEAPKREGEIFAPGCIQPTFVGTTYDIGIVANLATTMAVETLRFDGKNLGFHSPYIRWSGRDKAGQLLFKTEMLDVQRRADCPHCQ